MCISMGILPYLHIYEQLMIFLHILQLFTVKIQRLFQETSLLKIIGSVQP